MTDYATEKLPGTKTDESLIENVCLRDQEALAEIYDRFSSIVYSIALRVLHEESAAEEVMQEVFLHVWRNPNEYNPQHGPLCARLVLICRNRALDRLGGRKAEDGIATMSFNSCAKLGDLAEQKCKAQEMRCVIGSLPAIQRQILDCALFEGLTLGEIAASTGESVTSVKTHLRCALLSVRKASL